MMASAGTKRVLIIGAAGNFGHRLVRRLADEPGITLIIAGRRSAPLWALARETGIADVLVIDRDDLCVAQVSELAVDVIVDASGPFQLMRPRVIEVAIGAGVHYIDLADSREFVAAITRFNEAARHAGIAVIAGASSTPALSHAVVDHLVHEWQGIDEICATISPSNRQPVGLAVVRAILSMVGQPVRVFQDGEWVIRRGWGMQRAITFPDVGERYASLVDTPDLDLFVSRYRPQLSAHFEAALGLPLQHWILALLAQLVRWRLLRSLLPLAWPLHWLANKLRFIGKDCGAMQVRVSGRDAQDQPVVATGQLTATGETGPNVPVLACIALLRKLRDAELSYCGATACVGLLELSDFAEDFTALGISTALHFDSAPAACSAKAA